MTAVRVRQRPVVVVVEKSLDFPTAAQFAKASPGQRLEWAQLRCWAALIFDDNKALTGWRQLLRQARLDLACSLKGPSSPRGETSDYSELA